MEKAASFPTTTSRPSKRLLFDRRYGYIIDVWKDPSEEALSGGRGMFCVVPLAKSIIKAASQMINFAACSSLKAIENPGLFSFEATQANLNSQVKRIASSIKMPELGMGRVNLRPRVSPNVHAETNESPNVQN